MASKSFEELMKGYLTNQLSEVELTRFRQLMHQEENQDCLKRLIEQLLRDESVSGLSDLKRADIIFQKIMDTAEKQRGLQEGKVVQMEQRSRHSVWLRIVAVASILLIIGLGWLFVANNNKPQIPVAKNTEKKSDSLRVVLRREVNTTGKEKTVQLPDGSLIILADKSEITYNEPFRNGRNVTLIGKAYFKVAKDKTRPFTVISGALSTTALGTEFTVTAFKSTDRIVVRLYEGKVVVKAVKMNKWMKNDVYLMPGQEFIYSSEKVAKRAFKLKNFTAEQILNEEKYHDNSSIPQDGEGSWYMFNNQPLSQVLDDLSALYDVKIVYDKKDVQNCYFIGKYDRSESIATILKRIAVLNDLTIIKNDTAFILRK